MTCHKKLTDPFVIKNRMLALIECGLEAAKELFSCHLTAQFPIHLTYLADIFNALIININDR